MHSSFTFSSNTNRAPNYQQQSGFHQPVYNIGSLSPGFMTHQQHPNMFMNHAGFKRSFASVVSCEEGPNRSNANSNSGFLGSFFRHFNNKPQYPPMHQQPGHQQKKEFEDFTHLPCYLINNQYQQNQQFYYQKPPGSHINVKNPPPPLVKNEQFYHPQQQQPSANHSCSYATVTANFVTSFFGGYQRRPPQPQGQTMPKRPWFGGRGGFRCRGNGRWRNNKKFHENDGKFQKNLHEKERSSIERDINDDSCDFVNITVDKDETPILASNNPNETAKGTCKSATKEDDPPFLIYSLEEFPAIVATSKSEPAAEKKPPTPPAKNDDEGFVVVPTAASISTPSFTPKRLSLCEKLIHSPKKFFPKIEPVILKPCLKQRRRTMSEASDDFIVFADDDCDGYQTHESDCSDSESESDDSDGDDEMDGQIEDSDESEEEEEEDDDDGEVFQDAFLCRSPEVQVDSGVEERKVRFNLTPKVHVMRAWDFAYRACRKGDYWQQQARDRERFNKRISEGQKVLNPILDPYHREKIFLDRFQ